MITKIVLVVGLIMAYLIIGVVVAIIGAAIDGELFDDDYVAVSVAWPCVVIIGFFYGLMHFIVIPIAKKLAVIPVTIVALFKMRDK